MGGLNILHCTAKGGVSSDPEYANRVDAYGALGAVSTLMVVGFVITPRTFGARVKLSQDQLNLWGNMDDPNIPDEIRALFDKEKNHSSFGDAHHSYDGEVHLNKFAYKENVGYNENSKTISFLVQDEANLKFKPISGKGSRAHITLGCNGQEIHPRITGYDLVLAGKKELRALGTPLKEQVSVNDTSEKVRVKESDQEPDEENAHCEEKKTAFNSTDDSIVSSSVCGDAVPASHEVSSYNIEGAVLRCYGEGIWVIYPDNAISVSAIFTGFHNN